MEKAAFLEEITALSAKAEALRNNENLSKQDRYEVRSAIVKLANSVERPVEGAIRTLFETWPPLAALAVAINARWIHSVVESNEITASELSRQTGAEEQLISMQCPIPHWTKLMCGQSALCASCAPPNMSHRLD